MTVGLIDVDGEKSHGQRFPNLALMKLSAWHKSHGDAVEWCFPLKRYDRIYASKVFTFTPDFDFIPQTDDLRLGGTGYHYPDGGDQLPEEIEHSFPDYALYGINDTAYGFMTRGCPRGCAFCIVKDKEGLASRKVADLSEFWNGQRNIKLMDPNTMACPQWREIMSQLEEAPAWVDFTQGIDIRMLDGEKVEAINRLKIKVLHFAWDRGEDLAPLFRKWGPCLRLTAKAKRVFVLVNFGTSMEFNLHRIHTLVACGFDPYVMVYDKKHAPREILRLQRWVNNKFIFYKCRKFKEYRG